MRRGLPAAQVAAAGWKVPLAAALTGVLLVPWVAAAVSGLDETPYGFAGEYTDARGVSDLGQRWYDPRHQLLYGPDPAAVDEPAALLGDPRLTGSYTLNHDNPYRFTDPDGRRPRPTRTVPQLDPDGRLVWQTLLGSTAPAPGVLADTEAVGVSGEDDIVFSSAADAPTAATSIVAAPPVSAPDQEFNLISPGMVERRAQPWWWLEGATAWDELLEESTTADFRDTWDDLDDFLVVAHAQMIKVAEWARARGVPMDEAAATYERGGLVDNDELQAASAFYDTYGYWPPLD